MCESICQPKIHLQRRVREKSGYKSHKLLCEEVTNIVQNRPAFGGANCGGDIRKFHDGSRTRLMVHNIPLSDPHPVEKLNMQKNQSAERHSITDLNEKA